MPAARQLGETRIRDVVTQRPQALRRHQHVTLAGKDEGRGLDVAKLTFNVQFFDEAEAMGWMERHIADFSRGYELAGIDMGLRLSL